jgi:citrate lyase subunit beta/citryl-CoA lyase
VHPPRTYLYVPSDRPKLLAKASGRGSDALILDLEDGIDRGNHASARARVTEYVRAAAGDGPELWVRLGPEDVIDPEPLLEAGIRRFVLPKLTSERLLGLVSRTGPEIELLGLVESGRGLLDLPATTAHPSIGRVGVGEADLIADLGLEPTHAAELLAGVRLQIVIASAAAGLPAPVAPTSLLLEDLAEVEASTRRLVGQGFGARTCVHPGQIEAVHRGLAPTEEHIIEARAVLSSFDAAKTAGAGSSRTPDGTLVDEAVARRARATLARAGELQPMTPSARRRASSTSS